MRGCQRKGQNNQFADASAKPRTTNSRTPAYSPEQPNRGYQRKAQNTTRQRTKLQTTTSVADKKTSNLYLRPKLNNAIRGNTKKISRLRSILMHPCKHPFTPHGHAWQLRRHDSLPREKERRVHQLKRHIVRHANLLEHSLHIRRLIEPVRRLDEKKPAANILHRQTVLILDIRNITRDERQKDGPLVQHLVVLEIMQKAHRNEGRAPRQINGRARHAMRRIDRK